MPPAFHVRVASTMVDVDSDNCIVRSLSQIRIVQRNIPTAVLISQWYGFKRHTCVYNQTQTIFNSGYTCAWLACARSQCCTFNNEHIRMQNKERKRIIIVTKTVAIKTLWTTSIQSWPAFKPDPIYTRNVPQCIAIYANIEVKLCILHLHARHIAWHPEQKKVGGLRRLVPWGGKWGDRDVGVAPPVNWYVSLSHDVKSSNNIQNHMQYCFQNNVAAT